jgi:putative transcriptional regulator
VTRPTNSHSRRVGPPLSDEALDELLGAHADRDALDALAVAVVEPYEAREPADALTSGRARLLAALETTHRFDDLEAQVAQLLDIDVPRARAMLLDVDRASVWEAGPNEQCALFHVDGGEQVRDAVTGFVRMEPGATFPEHQHLGDETVLVLQGALRDCDGTVFGAGDVARMPAGSSHAFEVEGDLPLLYLAIVQRGVVFDGQPVYPGDPRA